MSILHPTGEQAELAAIVEITSDARGCLPVDLIRTAYIASRCGPIVLVLYGVELAAIDRVLDKLVAGAIDVHGVLYCTVEEAASLVSEHGLPRLALVSTERLQSLLRADPIRISSASEALELLKRAHALDGRWWALAPLVQSFLEASANESVSGQSVIFVSRSSPSGGHEGHQPATNAVQEPAFLVEKGMRPGRRNAG